MSVLLQIQIYSSSTNQVNKSFSNFKEKVYCGSFRNDGKLIVAGRENGSVQVFTRCAQKFAFVLFLKLRSNVSHTQYVKRKRVTSNPQHCRCKITWPLQLKTSKDSEKFALTKDFSVGLASNGVND